MTTVKSGVQTKELTPVTDFDHSGTRGKPVDDAGSIALVRLCSPTQLAIQLPYYALASNRCMRKI